MKQWLVLAATLVLLGNQTHAKRFYYVDIPMGSHADIASLRMQGLDVAGIDLERGIVSLVLEEKELKRTRGLGAVAIRELDRLDEEYKTPSELESILIEVEKLS